MAPTLPPTKDCQILRPRTSTCFHLVVALNNCIYSNILRKAVQLRKAFIRNNNLCWSVRSLWLVLIDFTPRFKPFSQRHQAELRSDGIDKTVIDRIGMPLPSHQRDKPQLNFTAFASMIAITSACYPVHSYDISRSAAISHFQHLCMASG
jgi:hypothetical protein